MQYHILGSLRISCQKYYNEWLWYLKTQFKKVSPCQFWKLICIDGIIIVMLDRSPLSSNPTKMVKHTQTIRRLLPTNSLSVFNHFVGLALKWIALSLFLRLTCFCYCYISIFDVLANIIFSYCHQQHSHYYFFSLFRVGFFIGSLPYGS